MACTRDLDLEDWKSHSANFIAITVQTWFRGYRARRDTRILLWRRYNWAATIIQRYTKDLMLRKQASIVKRQRQYRKMRKGTTKKKPDGDVTYLAFSNAAQYQDKRAMWHKAIEMRRAHGRHDTDMVLKSLLQAKSDTSRALTLVGNIEFSVRNDMELSQKTRLQLLPIDLPARHASNDSGNVSRDLDLESVPHNASYEGNEVSHKAVDMVRMLRERAKLDMTYKKSIAKSNDHGSRGNSVGIGPTTEDTILSKVLLGSYYSRNQANGHHGLKRYDKTCRRAIETDGITDF